MSIDLERLPSVMTPVFREAEDIWPRSTAYDRRES
jgi:hypothetical protein